MAGFIAREKNEKFACEKFLARNKVREMQEICGYKFVHFYPFFEPNWSTFHPKKEKKFSSIVGLLISMDYNRYELIVIWDMELKHFSWCKFWVSMPLNLFNSKQCFYSLFGCLAKQILLNNDITTTMLLVLLSTSYIYILNLSDSLK